MTTNLLDKAFHGYAKNGVSYRDKPAVIYSRGSKQWYKEGRIHRDGDKPAVIEADGKMGWYENGIIKKIRTDLLE